MRVCVCLGVGRKKLRTLQFQTPHFWSFSSSLKTSRQQSQEVQSLSGSLVTTHMLWEDSPEPGAMGGGAGESEKIMNVQIHPICDL